METLKNVNNGLYNFFVFGFFSKNACFRKKIGQRGHMSRLQVTMKQVIGSISGFKFKFAQFLATIIQGL